MCRLAWQLLGMLGNVLDLLGMLRNVLGMLGFTAYKAASGGVFLRCGTPRTLQKGMLRTPRTLQACLGRCKTCRGRQRTLPSMPESCQANLHILGSHNLCRTYQFFLFFEKQDISILNIVFFFS